MSCINYIKQCIENIEKTLKTFIKKMSFWMNQSNEFDLKSYTQNKIGLSTYLLTYLGLLMYLHIFLARVIHLTRTTYLKMNFPNIHKIVAFGKKIKDYQNSCIIVTNYWHVGHMYI
jgi:hypothetical protein